MAKKVLITVMTYPTISQKYDELVCTAGVQDDGSWIRIYPLPFRKLDDQHQFKKYQWIEAPFEKNKKDSRPESHHVTDIKKIKLLGIVDTSNNWSERKNILFKKEPIFTNLAELIEKAKNNERSFAIFKPNKIDDFIYEKTDKEWPGDKLALLEAKSRQLSLFQTAEEIEKEFLIVPKLPYKFSYKFRDDQNKKSTLMIEDWDVGKLYWDSLNKCQDKIQPEQCAVNMVKHEYFYEFKKKNSYFILGTLAKFHGRSKNPFVIVGTFSPPA